MNLNNTKIKRTFEQLSAVNCILNIFLFDSYCLWNYELRKFRGDGRGGEAAGSGCAGCPLSFFVSVIMLTIHRGYKIKAKCVKFKLFGFGSTNVRFEVYSSESWYQSFVGLVCLRSFVFLPNCATWHFYNLIGRSWFENSLRIIQQLYLTF